MSEQSRFSVVFPDLEQFVCEQRGSDPSFREVEDLGEETRKIAELQQAVQEIVSLPPTVLYTTT